MELRCSSGELRGSSGEARGSSRELRGCMRRLAITCHTIIYGNYDSNYNNRGEIVEMHFNISILVCSTTYYIVIAIVDYNYNIQFA